MMFIQKFKGNLIIWEEIVSLFQERTVTYWFRDQRPILEIGSAIYQDYVRFSAENSIRRKLKNKLPSELRSIDRISILKAK